MSSISNQLIGITILLFLFALVKRDKMMTVSMHQRFERLLGMVLVATLIEILILGLQHQSSQAIRILLFLLNIVGFCLYPLIVIAGAYLLDDSFSKYRRIIEFPLLIFILLTASSLWTGGVFTLDAQNHYFRGSIVLIHVVFFLYSFLIFAIAYYRKSILYDKFERIYLSMLSTVIIIAIIIQVCTPGIHIIWMSVSIAILLYYIFIREIKFTYDDITEVRNRLAYDQRIMDFADGAAYGIVVMDLNCLKIVNDQLGHMEGDGYIKLAAKIIRKSFKEIGTIYRIGGDEFCIIIPEKNVEYVESALEEIDDSARMVLAAPFPMEYSIAYGYAICQEDESYKECFQRADQLMYEKKNWMKEQWMKSTKEKR